jgi:hypothetical protein
VFVVYEYLEFICPFKEQVILLFKNLDHRFQEIGYILHVSCGVYKFIGGVFSVKSRGITK